MNNSTLKIFDDNKQLVEELSKELIEYFERELKTTPHITLALSGGNTPKLIYQYLAENYNNLKIWSKIKFFWGDERCVPPDDPESNYGVAKELLFDKLEEKNLNIFRIKGEENPEAEAERYAEVIAGEVEIENDLPCFDLMILGIGGDGHTASIFPPRTDLFNSKKICAATTHPATGQLRITVTGRVINNSANIIVIASGKSKSKILKEILTEKNKTYPAAQIKVRNGVLIWYADEDAAAELLVED